MPKKSQLGSWPSISFPDPPLPKSGLKMGFLLSSTSLPEPIPSAGSLPPLPPPLTGLLTSIPVVRPPPPCPIPVNWPD